jgi:hypothetical protein
MAPEHYLGVVIQRGWPVASYVQWLTDLAHGPAPCAAPDLDPR